MMAKITKGSSFSGATKYVLNKNKQAELLSTDGIRTKNINSIIKSFERQAEMNSRVAKPVGHISLNFATQDLGKLSNDKMIEVAHDYMKRMGIENTQYIIARHHDREHPHCHIIFNRVNNDGRTISDQNDRVRSAKICKELTIKNGLYISKGKESVKRHRLQGNDKVKYKIHDALCKHVPTSKSWMELYSKLRKEGIEMNFKMKGSTTQKEGIKFTAEGITFNGSKVDRQFSYSKIDYALRQNAQAETQGIPKGQQAERAPTRDIDQFSRNIESIASGMGGVFDLPTNDNNDYDEAQLRKQVKKKRRGIRM